MKGNQEFHDFNSQLQTFIADVLPDKAMLYENVLPVGVQGPVMMSSADIVHT